MVVWVRKYCCIRFVIPNKVSLLQTLCDLSALCDVCATISTKHSHLTAAAVSYPLTVHSPSIDVIWSFHRVPRPVWPAGSRQTEMRPRELLLHIVTVQRWQCATPPLLLIPPANPPAGLVSTVITHPPQWHTSQHTATPDSLHTHTPTRTHTHALHERTLHKKFDVVSKVFTVHQTAVCRQQTWK